MVHTKYKIVDSTASPFGGLHAISELFECLHFNELFSYCFGKIRTVRKYLPSENVKFLIGTILCGGDRLSDINRLSDDPIIPDLFGNGSIPYDTTIRNDLKHLGICQEKRKEFLFRLNELLLKQVSPNQMTIDIDGTASVVSGHQSNATLGYNQVSKSSRCFQHILVSWDEVGSPLYVDTRAGNRHCSYDTVSIMKDVLNRFSGKVNKILVRADSGFYNKELIEVFECYENVEYEIKVPKINSIIEKIDKADFKKYHESTYEYAKVKYTPANSKERVYFVERKKTNEGAFLFEELEYKYQIIVTNRDNIQPHTLFQSYNLRARQEKLICDLKNDFALGRITSNDFDVTKSAAWVSALSCVIMAIFRIVALRHNLHKYRLKKIRYYLFNIVAVFVKHARKKILKILSPPIGKWRYDQIIRRIHALC